MNGRSFLGLAACLVATAGLFAQAPEAAKTAAPAQREAGLYATMSTSEGDIVLKLFEKESPQTVANFRDLVLGRKEYLDPRTNQKSRKPLYNGLIFHRVIPGFMIQGGDPLGNGTGGTEPIPEERDPSLQFDRPGRLGMANAGPGTGSSQFFITEVPTPHLDGNHTIFGQVIEGLDVVNKIARVPRDARDRPLTDVKLASVTLKRVGPGDPVDPPKPVSSRKPVSGAKKPVSAVKRPAASSTAKPAAAKPKTTTTKPAAKN